MCLLSISRCRGRVLCSPACAQSIEIKGGDKEAAGGHGHVPPGLLCTQPSFTMSLLINLMSISFLHYMEGKILSLKDSAEKISEDQHGASPGFPFIS